MKIKPLALFVLISIGLSTKTYAQKDFTMKDVPYDKAKNKVIYEGEIPIPGVYKDSVFERLMIGCKSIYKGFAGKIVKNEPADGRLVANGVMQGMTKDGGGDMKPEARVKYVMTYTAADGKLTYQITDFMVEKGKKRPLESFYFNEPEVKMRKSDQEDFFHSIDYEITTNIKALTRKVSK